jgi:NAD(P)-dependent dehydrogenase (short-subunit alcohol dehydrogenase family)
VEDAVAGTVEQTGGIDVVIANAGVGGGGPVTLIDPAVFERVVRVNFFGVWNTLHASLPHVIERRGYLLPVASVAAITPQPPGMTPYASSKAAVEALAKGMRTELRHRGVTVGIAYFSWIDTDMVAAAAEHRTFQFMRSRIRGPGSKTYPLKLAIDAIERGIERRSETVVAPRWVHALLAFRGMVGPGIDRRLAGVTPEAMKMAEEEMAARGPGAFLPGGGGGEADARAGGYGRGVAEEPKEPEPSDVAEAAARGE